jgi:cellulose synthase/poly-beta-1,6-N-acetylglucosamine synthase-like glycosyltransferase
MTAAGIILLSLSVGLLLYTYFGYSLVLKALAAVRRPRQLPRESPERWPMISITVPMYNEEAEAAALIESLLSLDYPEDRRQILIVSDGSTDGTEEIVRRYRDRGVELLALPVRSGKTACENAASARLRGEIVVNTDASIRIHPRALRPLIAAFADPEIGLASGRDVSVSRATAELNVGESGYVGYEMGIRDLETAVHGIVGASGCFYAIRVHLHRIPIPDSLSRDFSAALKCEEHGYRAVSVRDAVCLVPRTGSIRREYSRKVRTITRGMETLIYKRALLNPFRHAIFSWMLVSHKICRWLAPWAVVIGAVGLAMIAPAHPWAWVPLALGIAVVAVGGVGWLLGDGRHLPRAIQMAAFALSANIAAMHATLRALRGDREAIWEPTRRHTQGDALAPPAGARRD